ncbi:hypothetical protein ND748_19695 [Frankia sp. AiPs1]|uniref:hypothetical protein n=1 Tax=Frankia sp. AiPs1 TaxID=573493 RepID=UPI002044273B|nr:hypothetical protein [Frankia sp. AiPs1]MCM3923883.1 hypothetical protein [Frankia sp. AiPs1]
MADISLRRVGNALGFGNSFSVCTDLLGFTGGRVPARLNAHRAQSVVSLRGYVSTLRGSNFDVTLILAGSDVMTKSDATVIDYAIYRAREIYADAGFCLRRVGRDPRTVANSLGHDDITSSDELGKTNKDLTVDGDTLPVVLPANMSVTEVDAAGHVVSATLGQSPVAGPCGHRDAASNSSVVMINGEETARTLAHEMGHFLGCSHPATAGTNLMAQTGTIQATGADPFDAVTIVDPDRTLMRKHCVMHAGMVNI